MGTSHDMTACREPVAELLELYAGDVLAMTRPPAVPEPPRAAAVLVPYVGFVEDIDAPEVDTAADLDGPAAPAIEPVIMERPLLSAAFRVLEWGAEWWFTSKLIAGAQPIAGEVGR